MKFLIVDDSSAIRAIVRRALVNGGFKDAEFTMAADGQEALDVMKAWTPDMVITDWHMPGMTGIEMLTQLRRRANDVRVGFVTTELSKVHLEEAFSLGAHFFLHKPFGDAELVSAVCDALGPQPDCANQQQAAPQMELNEAVLKEAKVVIAPFSVVEALFNKAFENRLQIEQRASNLNGDISLPSAVSAYVLAGSTDVRGICLLDHTAMLLVGSAISNVPVHEVAKVLKGSEAPKAVCSQTMSVLEGELVRLFKSDDGRKLDLAKTQIVKQTSAPLQAFIKRSPLRRDFTLIRKGLPTGIMTLVAR